MTKYERIAIAISSVALIVSISIPIINYFFFNPIEAELRYSGKLEVYEEFIFSGENKTGYRLVLENVGKRVISNIEIGAMTISPSITIPTRRDQIQTIPVRDFDFKSDGNRMFIKFPGSLGKNERITVFINGLVFGPKAESNEFRVDVTCNLGDGRRLTIFRGAGASD